MFQGLVRNIVISISLGTMLFSADLSLDFSGISMGATYPQFLNHFSGEDIINVKGSDDDYALFLRSTYKGVPYRRALYVSRKIFSQPAKMAFLFNDNVLFMTAFQIIAKEDFFEEFKAEILQKYGQPLIKSPEFDAGQHELEWTNGQFHMLMNYVRKGISVITPDDEGGLLPTLSLTSIPSIGGKQAKKVYGLLRSKGYINDLGILIKDDFNLNESLSFLKVDSKTERRIKVMLFTTKYGEISILYYNKNLLKEAMTDFL